MPPRRKATANDVLRVPNSLMQGLTTATPTELNRLNAFETTMLLGLLALVDQKHPNRDVYTSVSKILEIIEVGRNVAQTVDRKWTNADGTTQVRTYESTRYSPRTRERIQDALIRLHDRKVQIQRWEGKKPRNHQDRCVHVLEMFGFIYEREGEQLDVDDLPRSLARANRGSDERPVWRIVETDEDGNDIELRATGIVFRVSKELGEELRGKNGTVKFTLVARRIFGLLRRFACQPTAIRLLLTVVRQTDAQFRRRLTKLLNDLGFDRSHPKRSQNELTNILDELVESGIVKQYKLDPTTDRLSVTRNPDWYTDRVKG